MFVLLEYLIIALGTAVVTWVYTFFIYDALLQYHNKGSLYFSKTNPHFFKIFWLPFIIILSYNSTCSDPSHIHQNYT